MDNVSIQGTRIKLRGVRLLCRIGLGLKSVTRPKPDLPDCLL